MTNQEAIEILKRAIGEVEWEYPMEIAAAMDRAIEALSGGWISVKDRMPESAGLKVLVAAKTVAESVLQTKTVFTAFLGYGENEWYTPDVGKMKSAGTRDNSIHPLWEITHCMLLPEPPKEDI